MGGATGVFHASEVLWKANRGYGDYTEPENTSSLSLILGWASNSLHHLSMLQSIRCDWGPVEVGIGGGMGRNIACSVSDSNLMQ
jgi:hypothetical protein